jgi:transposase
MARIKPPQFDSLDAAQIPALLEELRIRLPDELYQLASRLLLTLQWLMEIIEQQKTSIRRLRRIIFGPKTESTSKLLGQAGSKDPKKSGAKEKQKSKGHGRLKALAYTGAKVVPVSHPTLCAGALCLECLRGKLRLLAPVRLIRIAAQPAFSAVMYELQRLRCLLCGKVFTAPAPPEAAGDKYSPSVGIMLAIERYGAGKPMYRTAKWQLLFGVPMPAATQWELIDAASKAPLAVYQALIPAAGQAEIFHDDDTRMFIEELARQRAHADATDEGSKPGRTGCFTTGIIAKGPGWQIALFMTGARYAGENLDLVLKHRAAELKKPLLMCDGLSHNESKEFETILCNCLSHGRRNFTDIIEDFPEECRFVIESMRAVYKVDAHAREHKLSDTQRLALHQEHSQPVMDALKDWMDQQIDHKRVEPNSGLGEAIAYMRKRWETLTRFLSVPGAPLDNNNLERALKMAILHRKNSMRYKTLHGAEVGDAFMSLIHTCDLNDKNPFTYLMALSENAAAVIQAPEKWFPWNYEQTLTAQASSTNSS